MAVNNEKDMCQKCKHFLVCSIWETKLSKFSEDAKKQLGVDIDITQCENFELESEKK